jgi:hypothetical protein
MTSKSTLVRESDGKTFRVKLLGHWSDIVADDGEQDSVKWYGGDGDRQLYVSASKGYSYEAR